MLPIVRKHLIMLLLSLAIRELRTHLPSILIHRSLRCILDILILTHFNLLSVVNFSLSVGISFLL